MKVRQEVKIGAIALIAFVAAYLGLNFLKGINIFEPENQYRVYLDNLSGTSVATPVMINGYKVGSVQKVNFGYSSGQGYRAELLLGLNPEIKVPKGSIIRTKTNVLSGSVLEITAPDQATQGFLVSGDSIPFVAGDDIVSTVSNKILPQVVELMPEIVSIVQRLGDLAHSSAIDSMLISLQKSSAEMNRAMLTINTAMKPLPQVMNNVEVISANLAQTTDQVKQLPMDSLISNLNATTENLRQMSAQLKSGEGTMGKLLQDPSLYNRLDSLAGSADALLKDLKANPKRYVRLSLF